MSPTVYHRHHPLYPIVQLTFMFIETIFGCCSRHDPHMTYRIISTTVPEVRRCDA